MLKRIKESLFFNVSAKDCDLKKVYTRIMEDNRRFARTWAISQIVFWGFCFFMSFQKEEFRLCRNAYIFAIILSLFVMITSHTLAKKHQVMTIVNAFLIKLALMGASLWIARIQFLHQRSTVMIYASVLIAPILFVNYTTSNIIIAMADIVAAALYLKDGIDGTVYTTCMLNLTLLSCVGVTLGHFVDKERFERFVFAEAAVQLAELQKRYAYYDQLTGVQNRRAYTEKTEELTRNGKDYIVVMADINGLKETNDTLGHEAGDALICGSAECLRRSFPGEIYRIGGDEFAVVLEPGADVEGFLEKLKRETAGWKDRYINGISISCGYATSGESSDPDDALKIADKRMYAEKSVYYKVTGKERRKR